MSDAGLTMQVMVDKRTLARRASIRSRIDELNWLPIYHACAAMLALHDSQLGEVAQHLVELNALPESRTKAVVLAQVRTLIDSLTEQVSQQGSGDETSQVQ